MNQTVRYVIFIALSLLIVVGAQMLELKLHPPKPHAVAVSLPSDAGAATTTTAAAAVTPPPAVAASAPTTQPEEAPGPSVTVDTSLWTAEFSPRGGSLTSFVLKGRKHQSREHPGQGVDLATPGPGQPLPLATDLEMPGGFDVNATYKLVSRSEGELVFQRSRGATTVTKRIRWKPDSYLLTLLIEISGAPVGPVPVKTYFTTLQNMPPRGFLSLSPRPELHQALCYINGDRSVQRRDPTSTKPPEEPQGTPAFAGIDEKYFLAAMFPDADPATASCVLGVPPGSPVAPGDQQAVLARTVTVPAGGSAETSIGLFLGPKEADLVSAAGHSLDRSVDLGFFAIIGRGVILPILRVFHGLVSNWGVAIILLTVLVKLLTLPLTHHQMKSMDEGRRLAPKVEEIKKKYAGDTNRINVETMKMYKEHGYQPLAGCVPMLIQLPVWYALYATLGASFDLYNEPFIHGWINDLTAIDPYYITPVLMTVTMILTQILTPQPAQQQAEMKYMMYFMPVMFGWFMLTLPAGLVLYIFTNNLLSIAQSLWFRRRFPPTAVAK